MKKIKADGSHFGFSAGTCRWLDIARKNERGSACIEIFISTLVIFALLAALINVPPIFICKQNLDYAGRKIVREVETTGKIGTETGEICEQLSKITGTEVKVIGWQADCITGTNKVQLRDEFSVTLESVYSVNVISVFGETISINIPMRSTFKGISEVYHK